MRFIPIILSAALVVASAPTGAFAAGARAVRAPSAAKTSPGAWLNAIGGLNAEWLNDSAFQDVQPTLGRIMFDAHMHADQAAAALAFVDHLPESIREKPEALETFPEEVAADAIANAIVAARAEAAKEAEAALASNDADALAKLNAQAAYLDQATYDRVRAAVRENKSKKTLDFGKFLARRLFGGGKKLPDSEKAAAAELGVLLHGANRLMVRRPDLARPEAKSLVPYAEKALAAIEERSGVADQTSVLLLGQHRATFGIKELGALRDGMRAQSAWTEFVAGLSLAAADKLKGKADQGDQSIRAVLKKAAADAEMHMPIPSWHAEHGKHASVAHRIEADHGKADLPSQKHPIPLGRYFGISVGADWSLVLIVALITSSLDGGYFLSALPAGTDGAIRLAVSLAGTIGLYLSVLLHEFGHALAAKSVGVNTVGIRLMFLGGAASMESIPRNWKKEFWITAAGPLVNVVLAAAAWGALHIVSDPILAPLITFFLIMNAALFIFNVVLPGLPMDGGRLVRSAIAGVTGDHYKASRLAGRLGGIVGIGLMLWGAVDLMSGNMYGVIKLFIGMLVRGGSKAEADGHPGTRLIEEPDGKLR